MEDGKKQRGSRVSKSGGAGAKRSSPVPFKRALKRPGSSSVSRTTTSLDKPRQLDTNAPKRRFAGVCPSSSLPVLLRDRESRGRSGRFVSRDGAGAWSPDPLHRSLGGSAHVLRRLKLSGELKGHRGCVNTVSCTPDGKYWITGSDDTMLMIWDCESHKRITSFPSGHTDNVFQGRVLPYTGNEKVVTCAADGRVRLTSLSRETSILMGEHEGRAHRLAIEPGSPHRFMTCGEDGVVLEFDLRTSANQKGRTLLKNPRGKSITGMALNPADPNYLFLCGSSPFLELYDTRKVDTPAARYCPASLRRSRREHITGCNVNWCGTEVIATYNPIGEVYRFDVKKNAVVPSNSPWRGGDRSVRQRVEQFAAASSGGGGGGGGGEAIDRKSDGYTVKRHRQGRNDYDEEDEEEEEKIGDDDEGYNYDYEQEEEEEDDDEEGGEETDKMSYLTKFTGHRNIQTVKQVTFYGPRSEFVVSGSDCGHIFVWDKETAKLEMMMFGDKVGAVNCLEPHPFLPTLATSGLARSAKVWRPRRSAVAPDKLTGKNGKSAGAIMAENSEYTIYGRGFQIPITPRMLLNIVGMYPTMTEHAGGLDDDGGRRQQRGGAGVGVGAGAGAGAGAAGEVEEETPRRLPLQRLLESIPSIRCVGLPRASEDDDDDDGDDEEEEKKEEEEEEDDDGGGYWAGGDLMNEVGEEGERREEMEDDDEEEKEGDDNEEEKGEEEEDEDGDEEKNEDMALEGPRHRGVAARAEAAGLSFEVVSSQSESDGGNAAI